MSSSQSGPSELQTDDKSEKYLQSNSDDEEELSLLHLPCNSVDTAEMLRTYQTALLEMVCFSFRFIYSVNIIFIVKQNQ